MNCKEFEEHLPLYLYHELRSGLEAASNAHVASCEPCRVRLDKARSLHELLSRRSVSEPSPALLAECREALREALDGEPEAGGWQGLLWEWFSFLPGRPGFRAAGALTVLVFGFGLGWTLRPSVTAMRAGSPTLDRSSIVGSDLDSMRIGGISGVVPDPQTGQVRITLDAARRVNLEGSLDDPRIRHVLLYAVKSYDNPGIRRDTLDCLRAGGNNPDVREVLLYAMGHDSNPGVRLEALDVVRGLSWAADSRRAFLDALQHDTNAGLRAAAVGELVKHADRDMLPALKRLAANDASRYVRLKSASALRGVDR